MTFQKGTVCQCERGLKFEMEHARSHLDLKSKISTAIDQHEDQRPSHTVCTRRWELLSSP